MGFAFNPFTGNFDAKGSGGGGASYIDGEVQNFSALPETLGSPAVDSAYLVREAEGTWLLNRKPAGIYIRTANTGTRASDWTYAGEFPDVFSDANFVLYDNGDSTKNLQFQLSGIDTATTRTLTAPNASGTIALTGQLTDTQIFTSNGTWTKPAGAKLIHYFLIGGGGGGGAGNRRAAGSTRGGGGGGSGGAISAQFIDAARLGSTESVTIGAGGTGGTNSANDVAGGQNGSDGGTTSFGSCYSAFGGPGGTGGSTGAANGGSTGLNRGVFYGSSSGTGGGGAGATTTNGSVAATQMVVATGGGGGTGISNTNVASTLGGAGGQYGDTQIGTTSGGAGGSNAAGSNGLTTTQGWVGTGGGGGAADSSTFAGNVGGNGGLYGGGGGGGSGALNGAGGSTAGGDGANGIAIITTYF